MKMIRYFTLVFIVSFISQNGTGQEFHPVDEGSSVKFTIKNFGLNITGSMKGLEGSINFNPTDPASASFNVSINPASVNTGIDGRDEHLRKNTYFDVQKFPKISILSKQITASGKNGEYMLNATITMKGVSRDISFPFKTENHNGGLLFTGEFTLNRRDFKVGGSSLVLSDNLTVDLSIFAKRI